MSDTTYRSGRKKGFVVLYRAAAQDTRLSLESRGLLALMISLPDDWEYTVSGLAIKAGCGRDKVRRLLRELQAVGYLIREQSHDRGGKFSCNTYVLQDEAPPLDGNTVNGENRQRVTPSAGFSTQNNKDTTEEEINRPPKAPQGAERRKSKYALQDEAKPILRAYVGQDDQLARALADFIGLREQLRAINSAVAIKAILRKLDKLSGGSRTVKFQLLEEAMANSWKSVFPLKAQGRQSTAPASRKTVEQEEIPTW